MKYSKKLIHHIIEVGRRISSSQASCSLQHQQRRRREEKENVFLDGSFTLCIIIILTVTQQTITETIVTSSAVGQSKFISDGTAEIVDF